MTTNGIDLEGLDVERQLIELDRADFEDDLMMFFRAAWRNIDSAEWAEGRAVQAVAEHLEAVVDGQIKRLIINIPPRHSKSSLVSVAFPAWVWAQSTRSAVSGPGVPILTASYGDRLAMRDSRKSRQLIESPWYRRHWGERYSLLIDQNTKDRFINSEGGERLVTSVGAKVTGEGGNLIIVDDPNAANEVSSEAKTQEVIDWWDGTMSSRLSNMKKGAFIVIQQRLAENDLTGHILEKQIGDWQHLVLPMRYEPDRSFYTSIGWKDWRTEPGELLWPERFGEEEVGLLEKQMGPYTAAGQLQQRPEPAGGGVIKREWWKLWEEENFPPMDFIMASLDTAYTLKTTNDFSAMTVWGVFSDRTYATTNRFIGSDGRPSYVERDYAETAPKLMLMHAFQARLEIHELVEKVATICRGMKVDKLVIENKAAGHSVSQELRRLYGNEKFAVQLYDPKSIDKLSRLYSIQHLFSDGMVYAPDRAWAEMTITQVGQFPKGRHDDIVDTVSQAIRHMRDLGLLQRVSEKIDEYESLKTYPGKGAEPLYPA